MVDKRKKRARDLSKKTGMSHQCAVNALAPGKKPTEEFDIRAEKARNPALWDWHLSPATKRAREQEDSDPGRKWRREQYAIWSRHEALMHEKIRNLADVEGFPRTKSKAVDSLGSILWRHTSELAPYDPNGEMLVKCGDVTYFRDKYVALTEEETEYLVVQAEALRSIHLGFILQLMVICNLDGALGFREMRSKRETVEFDGPHEVEATIRAIPRVTLDSGLLDKLRSTPGMRGVYEDALRSIGAQCAKSIFPAPISGSVFFEAGGPMGVAVYAGPYPEQYEICGGRVQGPQRMCFLGAIVEGDPTPKVAEPVSDPVSVSPADRDYLEREFLRG